MKSRQDNQFVVRTHTKLHIERDNTQHRSKLPFNVKSEKKNNFSFNFNFVSLFTLKNRSL